MIAEIFIVKLIFCALSPDQFRLNFYFIAIIYLENFLRILVALKALPAPVLQ
jgi:hypothetical protein